MVVVLIILFHCEAVHLLRYPAVAASRTVEFYKTLLGGASGLGLPIQPSPIRRVTLARLRVLNDLFTIDGSSINGPFMLSLFVAWLALFAENDALSKPAAWLLAGGDSFV